MVRWSIGKLRSEADRRLPWTHPSFMVGLAWVRFGVAPGPGEAEDQGEGEAAGEGSCSVGFAGRDLLLLTY